MRSLISIQIKNNKQLVSARDLYQGLEIKRRFSAWWEQNSKGFEEEQDFQPVLISTPRENRGSFIFNRNLTEKSKKSKKIKN
ncbi:antA/AntB antirepressor family protein [Lactobacillus helveticus]|nr:antA/AntB antirepressor family protein [Lactobacillus helveticus]